MKRHPNTICEKVIQIDLSNGQGHCWRSIDPLNIPADIQEEIAAEIIDGKADTIRDFLASNGQHYRW